MNIRRGLARKRYWRRNQINRFVIHCTGDEIMKGKMIDNFTFFLENYDDLYHQFGHSFLVIKNKEVIGVYNDFAKAVAETKKHEKIGNFIVQECNGNDSGYSNYIASSEIVIL
jgi:hypothetical protein